MKERSRFPWLSSMIGVVALGAVVTLFASGRLNNGHSSFGGVIVDWVNSAVSEATGEADRTYRITLDDLGRDEGLLLSGYPSYAAFTLPVLRDTEAAKARLILTGRQDVSQAAVVSLRVIVNGERVMERILQPGQTEFRWIVELPQSLMDGSEARISFLLHGDLPDELCHNDRSIGAALMLSSATEIKLVTKEPVSSVRDVMALAPAQVTLAVPTGERGRDYHALATYLGSRLIRSGYRVETKALEQIGSEDTSARGLILLGSQADLERAGLTPLAKGAPRLSLWVGESDVAHVALSDAQGFEAARFLTSGLLPVARSEGVAPVLVKERAPASFVALPDLGTDTSIQRMTLMRSWDVPYALGDMPEGRMPETLRIDLRLPDGPGDFTNLVHTELNGLLIDSRTLPSAQVSSFTVRLPKGTQGLRNTAEITLQRFREQGGCEITARRYPVQLLPDSGLTFGGDGPVAGFAGLPGRFKDGVTLIVPSNLPAGEEAAAIGLLAQAVALFVPYDVTPRLVYADAASHTLALDGPFIAYNHVPAGVSTNAQTAEARLKAHSGAARISDTGALEDLVLLERVAARKVERAPEPGGEDIISFIPGLVLARVGEATVAPPSLMGVRFGREEVMIVHRDNEGIDAAPPGGYARTRPSFLVERGYED